MLAARSRLMRAASGCVSGCKFFPGLDRSRALSRAVTRLSPRAATLFRALPRRRRRRAGRLARRRQSASWSHARSLTAAATRPSRCVRVRRRRVCFPRASSLPRHTPSRPRRPTCTRTWACFARPCRLARARASTRPPSCATATPSATAARAVRARRPRVGAAALALAPLRRNRAPPLPPPAVLRAVASVNGVLSTKLKGFDVTQQVRRAARAAGLRRCRARARRPPRPPGFSPAGAPGRGNVRD